MAFELWKTSKHVCVSASFSLWRCQEWIAIEFKSYGAKSNSCARTTSVGVCLCVWNVLSLRWISFASKWLFRTQNIQHLIHIDAKWKTMDTLALWSRSGLLFFFSFCSTYVGYHVCLSFFFDSVWTVQWIQPFFQPFKGKFHAKIMALFFF